MLTLLKNAQVYAPEKLGRKDVLLANDKIVRIGENLDLGGLAAQTKVYDLQGAALTPGFIDQHVHLIGGGGEGGFATRTPEVMLTDLTTAGITTVVGVLGTDDVTRHMESLLAKANGLEQEGISAWIYSGSYPIPTPTLTGSVRRDMILIDKVIGTGEIAMSDHRSSCPTKQQFAELAAEARVGGILSGKAGVLHIHVGPGPKKIDWLFELLKETDIPITQFTPTHMNRYRELLEDGIRFAKRGGMIDITTSSQRIAPKRVQPPEAIQICLAEDTPLERITFSSDGNGSMPEFDDAGKYCGLIAASPKSLHNAVKTIVQKDILPLEDALRFVTVNPADSLKLPGKGRLAEGCDADLVVLDANFDISYVFAKGVCMIEDKAIRVKGTFEK